MAGVDDAVVNVRGLIEAELDSRKYGARSLLARDVGVAPQTVTKWVKGEQPIPNWRWPSIEEALGLPPLSLARAAGLDVALGLDEVSEADGMLRFRAAYPAPRFQADLTPHQRSAELLAAFQAAMEITEAEWPPEDRNAMVSDMRRLADLIEHTELTEDQMIWLQEGIDDLKAKFRKLEEVGKVIDIGIDSRRVEELNDLNKRAAMDEEIKDPGPQHGGTTSHPGGADPEPD